MLYYYVYVYFVITCMQNMICAQKRSGFIVGTPPVSQMFLEIVPSLLKLSRFLPVATAFKF